MSRTTLRNLIISVATFVIVGGGVLLLFFQVVNSSQVLEEQIFALAAQNKQEAALLRLERIAQNSEDERNELASYFLLRESDSISFLSEIETLAPSLGLNLKTTSLQQVSQDDKDWIEASVSVSGSRAEVERFIESLELIPFVSRITSITMNGNSPSTWQADITIQVQLLNYVQ